MTALFLFGGTMALYSNTLYSLRQHLSSMVGDLIRGDASGGSVTDLDDASLLKGNDYYSDRKYRCYIYDASGSILGQERVVTDSTGTQLILSPAYSSAVTANNKYELHHIFTAAEYLKAINLAIDSVADGEYLIPKIDTTTIPLVADTYEYTLPTDMFYIHRITNETTTGKWEKQDVIDPFHYDFISPRKVKFDENRFSIEVGTSLRLEGQGKQDTVSLDATTVLLPTDWLVQKAITFLPRSKIESNKLDDTFRRAELFVLQHPATNWPEPTAQKVIE
ncbi:hypothetical protein LCGC14_1206380 [marine sediment metagenome]|uniref:Uncharacterized protein n=1 Tax=marine sediment metagenome TaxID=412755 RepID=A0A0F9M2R2_9ZZZZ